MFRIATLFFAAAAAPAFAQQPNNGPVSPRIAIANGSVITDPKLVAEFEENARENGRRQARFRIVMESFAGITPLANAYLRCSEQARAEYRMEQWLKSGEAQEIRDALHQYYLNNPQAVSNIARNGNGLVPAANPKK